jgi:hypothetical protein
MTGVAICVTLGHFLYISIRKRGINPSFRLSKLKTDDLLSVE